MISFIIYIDPVAKGRPRITRTGHAYTPTTTRLFENALRALAAPYKPNKPLTGPLHVDVVFRLKKPKKSKNTYPIVRPDTDNFLKAVLDCGNGIFWEDDSQIVEIHAQKVYSEKPAIEIIIKAVA